MTEKNPLSLTIRSVTNLGDVLRQSVLDAERLVWAVSYVTLRGIDLVKYELEYLAKRSGTIEIYVTTDHSITSPEALSTLLEISRFSDTFILRNIDKINFRAKIYFFHLKDGRIRILSGSHDLSGSIDNPNNHSFLIEGNEGDIREVFGITGDKDILSGMIQGWNVWVEQAVPWTVKKNQDYNSQRTETGRRIERELDERGGIESAWSNDVKKGYIKRRDALKITFPEAYRFLIRLEQFHDQDERFHIGTDRNLQMYFEDAFLFYLKIVDRKATGPHLVFSPRFHGHLKEATRPTPDLFFGRITKQREIFDTTPKGSSTGEPITVKPEEGGEFFRQADQILESLK